METINNLNIEMEELIFPIIEHSSFMAGETAVKDAVEYHEPLVITGFPGSGKTTLLHKAMKDYENTFYYKPGAGIRRGELLYQIGLCVGYGSRGDSPDRAIEEIVTRIRAYRKQTVIMIDEAEHLIKRVGGSYSLTMVDNIREIQEKAGAGGLTFILAGSDDFVSITASDGKRNQTNSKYKRRFLTFPLKVMAPDFVVFYLDQIEEQFHVHFDRDARTMLMDFVSKPERYGIGIVSRIIDRTLRKYHISNYPEYHHALEVGKTREEALHVFDQNETVTVSGDAIRAASDFVMGAKKE